MLPIFDYYTRPSKSSRTTWETMQTAAEEKRKAYVCVCWSADALTPEKLQMLTFLSTGTSSNKVSGTVSGDAAAAASSTGAMDGDPGPGTGRKFLGGGGTTVDEDGRPCLKVRHDLDDRDFTMAFWRRLIVVSIMSHHAYLVSVYRLE
jgi:hypothetical protein